MLVPDIRLGIVDVKPALGGVVGDAAGIGCVHVAYFSEMKTILPPPPRPANAVCATSRLMWKPPIRVPLIIPNVSVPPVNNLWIYPSEYTAVRSVPQSSRLARHAASYWP